MHGLKIRDGTGLVAVLVTAWIGWGAPAMAADGGNRPVPTVRGVLEAPEVATLAAETPGRLLSLPAREGEAFSKGDELATFDCAPLEAQLRAAEATLRRANLELGSRGRLAKLGSMGKLDVGIAAADAEAAKAEVALRRTQVEKCVVVAPFDGWVVGRKANAHEVLTPGEPLLDIIGGGTPVVRLIVPSAWLKWLKSGWALDFAVDETGSVLPAKVIRLGALVDPVSQTVPVFARLNMGEETRVRPGMSGSARFAPPDSASSGRTPPVLTPPVLTQ